MKFILILLLTTTALRAQVPHIDYMIADEAKSQLQIHGTFGPDHTGGATIEGVPCSVRFWSDTMVICDLPDSGAGSGGHVIVQQMSGTSNARMLSIISFKINDRFWWYNFQPSEEGFYRWLDCNWNVNWRADIGTREIFFGNIPFEISKVSFGEVVHNGSANGEDGVLPWSDSTKLKDSSISLTGSMDLENYIIKFGLVSMQTTKEMGLSPFSKSVQFHPLQIHFDTLGAISTYVDSLTSYSNTSGPIRKEIYLKDSKILFPPGIKNSVAKRSEPNSCPIKIFTHFGSEDHQISLEAEEPLGETTASLYSIEGRLLRERKISIPAAGMYSFDVSGIHSGMGFLVLKTQKGIVAGKVVF